MHKYHKIGRKQYEKKLSCTSFISYYGSIPHSMFKKYNQDLLESYNQRVSTTFFEITTQTYNIAGKLSYDPQLWGILSRDYKTEDAEHVF